MQPGNPTSNPGESDQGTDFEAALAARLRNIGSDQYARETERILRDCWQWIQRERDVDSLVEITVTDCRRWVQFGLGDRVADGELGARSAHTYYDIARATFEWWVRDETLDTNPMKSERVKEELPELSERAKQQQQVWPPESRQQLLRHVDKQVEAALDETEDAPSRAKAFRDRTLCYLLADTGVRVAEICAVPNDDDRNGLRWRDVDLDSRVIEVLGKAREWQPIGLPRPTAKKMEVYQMWLEPSPETPVVPSLDPTKQGGDGPLPALTTNGARTRLKALSKAAEAFDEDGNVLKPHGARRLLGTEVYHGVTAEKAQRVMRHQSIETTHESYEHLGAVEIAEDVEAVRYGSEEDT